MSKSIAITKTAEHIDFIKKVFKVMDEASWHQYQVLTKRADRMAELSPQLSWPENVWMGVTVEDARYTGRIDALRSTGAAVKFLSLEPLLSPIEDLDLQGIDWVIVGGESGPKARPMEADWARSIQDQCVRVGVPFFFNIAGTPPA